MTTALDATQAIDIISQMRTATLPAHEKLDNLIMASDPFSDRESYSRLLIMQYCLQRDLEPLYHDASLKELLPDLESRSRLHLVEQDMADLGLTLPQSEEDTPALPLPDLASNVGWLFVLEGSRLGAASLFRRASAFGLSDCFGARHLAGPAEGPGTAWRIFAQTISTQPFNDEEKARATVGALAAFDHAAALTRQYVDGAQKG